VRAGKVTDLLRYSSRIRARITVPGNPMHNLPVRILRRKVERRASAILIKQPFLAAAALLCVASSPAPAAVDDNTASLIICARASQ